MKISDKQREMLAFIEDFVGENKYPPTLEEIRNGLNFSSKSLVNYHLAALESAALLCRSPNKSRGIRLAGETDRIRVPVVVKKDGGQTNRPSTELKADEVIELTSDIVPDREDLYALKIQDDSLLDAFVNKGDVVVIQRQDQAKNGDMVAVHLSQQKATLPKTFLSRKWTRAASFCKPQHRGSNCQPQRRRNSR